MLSLYHHISSIWNYTIAYVAQEKADHLSVVEPHYHPISSDIPDVPHSVPPPIRSLSLFYLVVTYKNLHQITKDATVSYTSSNLLFLPLGLANSDIGQGQLQLCIKTLPFLPKCCLCVTLHHTPYLTKIPLFK